MLPRPGRAQSSAQAVSGLARQCRCRNIRATSPTTPLPSHLHLQLQLQHTLHTYTRRSPQLVRPRPYIHPTTSSPTATISFLSRIFGRAHSPATMSATTTKVQSIIDENAVAVFSKSYCPYCRSAKKLLSDSGANFYVIELDQVDDGSAIQAALGELTGQTTVPNIFIAQKHIGGNSDLQAKKGDLPTLLKDAGAI
ncbi:glutaredoxin [Pyrenochaeta sp. DS3sAY3a]|nr:glutaredoxin [Pyrenochaeta sp. DS3sAY3a]